MAGFGDFFQGATQFAQTLSADFKERKRKADERELLRKQLDFVALLDQEENRVRTGDFDETAYANNEYFDNYQSWYDTQVDTMLKDVQDEELRERIEMSFRQMYQPSWNRVQATLENKAADKANAETNNALNQIATAGYDPTEAAVLITQALDMSEKTEQNRQLDAMQYGTQALVEYAEAQAIKIAETEGVDAANAFIDSYSTQITVAGYSMTLGDVNKGKLKTVVAARDQQRKDSEDTALDATYNSLYGKAWRKDSAAYDTVALQEILDMLGTKTGEFNNPGMTRMWQDRLTGLIKNKGKENLYNTYGTEAVNIELMSMVWDPNVRPEDFLQYTHDLMVREDGGLSPEGFNHFNKLKEERQDSKARELDEVIKTYVQSKVMTGDKDDKAQGRTFTKEQGFLASQLLEEQYKLGRTGDALIALAKTVTADYVKMNFTAQMGKNWFESNTLDTTEQFMKQYEDNLAPLVTYSDGSLDFTLVNKIAEIAGWKGVKDAKGLEEHLEKIVSEGLSYAPKDLGVEKVTGGIDPELRYPVFYADKNKFIVRVLDQEDVNSLNAEYGKIDGWEKPIANHEAWYVYDEKGGRWIYYKPLGVSGSENPAAKTILSNSASTVQQKTSASVVETPKKPKLSTDIFSEIVKTKESEKTELDAKVDLIIEDMEGMSPSQMKKYMKENYGNDQEIINAVDKRLFE